MKNKKTEEKVIYVVGDINDADYVGVKITLTDKSLEKAFKYFLKEVKKHNGIIENMEVFNIESEDIYDEDVSEFIPYARNDFAHTIHLVQDISPDKKHKTLFRNEYYFN